MKRNVTTVRILIVGGDSELNRFTCSYLSSSGFITRGYLNARDAYDEIYSTLCDLIISDIMMPEIDRFELARTIRQVNKTIPILFIPVKDDLNSKQKGFQSRIDDYMVELTEVGELLLRVRALFRRVDAEAEGKITIGNLALNADTVTVVTDGTGLPVTTREFNIPYKLLSYPNKIFSREQLTDEFWGLESNIGLWAADVYITGIREKFSVCDDFPLKTVRGLRYKAMLR